MESKDIIITEINRLCKTCGRVFVALDGRCGSGKTTLAGEIAREIPCTVLHMDDYFLRPEQRTPKRYAAPGENVDHERFLQEVLQPLHIGRQYICRPFDCSTMSLQKGVPCEAENVVLAEGSYACHPALWDYYDLHIFLTVSPDVQIERIRKRCGEDAVAAFKSRWIPLEERYFSAFSIEDRCDLRLTND